MFVNGSHFHPSQIFVGEDRSLPLVWIAIRDTTRVDSCVACKFWTRVDVTVSDKHSRLLLYENNYDRKKLYDTGPGLVFD
jgi:hypothetical protein